MQTEINTINLAIKNLDATGENMLQFSYSPENYNTDYGRILSNWSHEMWLLSRDMKKFKEEYVLQ
jgi:hypothetical protein